jgi:hypothetical protein
MPKIYSILEVEKLNPTAHLPQGNYTLETINVRDTGVTGGYGHFTEEMDEVNDDGQSNSEVLNSLAASPFTKWPPIVVAPADKTGPYRSKYKWRTMDGIHRLAVASQLGYKKLLAFVYHPLNVIPNPVQGFPYEHHTPVPFKGKLLVPAKRYVERYQKTSKKHLTVQDYYDYDFTLFSDGNKKIASNVGVWDLPAGDASKHGTCGQNCRMCYAIRDAEGPHGEDLQVKRFRNLDISLQPFFVEAMIKELMKKARKYTAVRVHSAGDFYSQAYVNKWAQIARLAQLAPELKHLKFYAYTKRMGKFDFKKLMAMPNFTVIDSFGWTDDDGTPMLNYGDIAYLGQFVAARKGKDTMVCPCGLEDTITKKQYEALRGKGAQDASKICGSTGSKGCTYCQTKEAQKWPTVFLEH